ncbi:MAG: RsmE family RNA methyltransferase [Candidatus Poribacteria bacterium]|nr:RsmE family RNA methyltransferase [Candidatus Poribacteria bacterium]
MMHSFYAPNSEFNEDFTTISNSEHHHLRNVLRLQVGDTIRIIDGEGSVYIAEIRNINAESTNARILNHEYITKTTPSITLFQGMPKHEKMELILQKTTELGVSYIVPIITERSLQKPSESRCERWNRIVLSATKQCGRVWQPELSNILNFQECLNTMHSYALRLILWEKEKQKHIKSVLRETPKVDSIALVVGPEGGFTEKEIDAAIDKGCIPVRVGTNILRTETAAITGIVITVYEYEL